MIVSFGGEIDIATSPVLRERIASHTGGPLLVDLREVSFMDLSALHVLLDADAAARRQGWVLRVAVQPGPVLRLLRLTGAERRLTLVDGVAEALAA